jgi:hypothetical protein
VSAVPENARSGRVINKDINQFLSREFKFLYNNFFFYKIFLLLLNRRGPIYSKKSHFGVCAKTPKFKAHGQRGSGFTTTLEFREIRPYLAFFVHFRGFRKNREKH